MGDSDSLQSSSDNTVSAVERETSYVGLTKETIKSADAINFLTTPSSGAINLFLGVTRQDEIDSDGNTSGQVTSLYYESYEAMAIKMMNRLVKHTIDKFKLNKCYVIHRLGLVKLCEASILIGCSSAHRQAAHEATYYLLNQIKKIIPIWKRINGSEEPEFEQSYSTWSSRSEAFWLPRSSES
ncbi:molybdopterin synthase catalytic subunit 2-like [Panonychus citri]|uniref:molybdopterin synthase catalytic subunit 2-like n=1 Tax=Panonychus citri TaxID=50023 RepID=UPI002307377E|nr:molybdopterin synthase catalytic subunit 2-like [Panonychus citri]